MIDVKQRSGRFRTILIGVLVLCVFPVSADEEVVFPDPALAAAVQEALGLGSEPIHSEDLEQLSSLLAGSEGIADLTGMEACIGLKQLHLHFNQIIDLGTIICKW